MASARAHPFEGFDNDQPAAATRATAHRRSCFGLAVRVGAHIAVTKNGSTRARSIALIPALPPKPAMFD